MEMEEIQTEECKFPRINKEDEQYQYEVDDAGEVKKSGLGGIVKLYGRPSSRIVRVSRASGGKDRHSKVLTSKGLRDRRVRLSVNTAIQFYDLQDRLGCDQPSKAVEWLLKAAAPSIAELPPLEAFPDTLQLSDEKRSSVGTEPGFDSVDVEMDDDPNYNQQQQQPQPCCSNSETSKGSGLSLSRSDSRLKARERAKERATEKEKEKENKSSVVAHHQNMHPSSSFTELLIGGMGDNNNNNKSNTSPNGSIHQNTRQWSTNHLEYFTSGLLGPTSTRGIDHSTGFSGQIYLGNPLQPLRAVSSPMFSITGDHQPELQQFPFGGDNLVPAVTSSGGSNCNGQSNTSNDYNLNFSISASASSFSGFNRGTLQSNSSSSPSTLPHFQSSFMAMAMAMAAGIQIRKEKERTKFIEKLVPHLHPWQLKIEAASVSQRKHTCFFLASVFLILHCSFLSTISSYFLKKKGRKSLCLLLLVPLQLAHSSKLGKIVYVFFRETSFVLRNLPFEFSCVVDDLQSKADSPFEVYEFLY